MGDLLELHTLNEVRLASRENIVQTYLALASKVPGTHQQADCRKVISCGPESVGFTNFSARLNWKDEAEADEGLAELASLASRTSLFVMEGDPDFLTEEFLFSRGWILRYELAQMAWQGAMNPPALEVVEALEHQERVQASLFMTDQFFPAGSRDLREAIISATSLAPVGLFTSSQGYQMEGAVMLVDTEGCIGLYNLCVEKRKRGKRLGGAIVQWCQARASQAGVPLVLQCSQDLVPFYKSHGFEVSGRVECWCLAPPDLI